MTVGTCIIPGSDIMSPTLGGLIPGPPRTSRELVYLYGYIILTLF